MDLLVHYRPDGTVVQTSNSGTGTAWFGAAILPGGNWVTTRIGPKHGVNIFDSVTGAEIAHWNMPPGFGRAPIDVGVFSDGTLAVVEQSGEVWHLDVAGNLIASWLVSKHPYGILVDARDHVWTCDIKNGVLWHTDDKGNKINSFSTGSSAMDVTIAKDGTLFVGRRDFARVSHLERQASQY